MNVLIKVVHIESLSPIISKDSAGKVYRGPTRENKYICTRYSQILKEKEPTTDIPNMEDMRVMRVCSVCYTLLASRTSF